MNLKNYRFNRKDGIIYLESEGSLQNLGSSLQMIVLSATNPTWEQPFPNAQFQYWVRLTFVDVSGALSNALLNNGTTNALDGWLKYKTDVEQKYQLCGVITTISLIEGDGDYFDYSFSGIPGKPGLGDRMRSLIASLQVS
ncbi:hypothetical protein [Cylindrospermum sp. FACHB-282]|uniref:hypothetical protein n=1 Tax=Cylindrospermum sp. FACHB-282 TaxID=2692794 RepID=UPI0016857DD0|nr:hypothetical protein [Cylindrospermum sp. FACHB-282]MBD2386001.1 hypothetical protein [Cylindrospermum sp. FACHB-282]